MSDILGFYKPDGTTVLPLHERAGDVYPLLTQDLVFSDEGGSGIAEFVIKNISSNNKALRVEITSSQPDTDVESGSTLLIEYSFLSLVDNKWSNYAASITIPEIPAGRSVKVRKRTTASISSETTTHLGTIFYRYLRSSV